jgi:predicted O-methyltransferase YrrM
MIDYKKLEEEALPGAFSIYDMEVLVPEVQKLNRADNYLEIGTDRGRSLSVARMVSKKGVHIYGVDLQEDPIVPGTDFIRGDSVEVSKRFEDIKISVLFIDGDHSYEGCKRDIEAWYPNVKKGGVMLFHDCDESSPGVIRAVAEFVDKNKSQIKHFELLKRTDKNTSMAIIKLK